MKKYTLVLFLWSAYGVSAVGEAPFFSAVSNGLKENHFFNNSSSSPPSALLNNATVNSTSTDSSNSPNNDSSKVTHFAAFFQDLKPIVTPPPVVSQTIKVLPQILGGNGLGNNTQPFSLLDSKEPSGAMPPASFSSPAVSFASPSSTAYEDPVEVRCSNGKLVALLAIKKNPLSASIPTKDKCSPALKNTTDPLIKGQIPLDLTGLCLANNIDFPLLIQNLKKRQCNISAVNKEEKNLA